MNNRMQKLEALIIAAICLLCAAITGYYLIAGYGAYLDADMASELALAQHLAEKGALISDSWGYSTEVRVISTQLVFTPLMALFSGNWRLVRTLGCMILLLMMAGSMVFCARSLGAKRRYAYLTAALGVLPWSTVYAQMVVIGAFYVPHAVLTCLLIGLCARALRMQRGNKRLWAAAFVLAALMCATSIRYILCAALPAAAAGLWMALFPDGERGLSRGSDEAHALMLGTGVLASGALGYVLGQRALAMLYTWNMDYMSSSRVTALYNVSLFDLADSAIDGLLKLLGYTEGSRLFSLRGILSMGTVLLAAVCVLLFVRALRAAKGKGVIRFGVLTAVMSAVLTFATFLFVEGMYLNRYWIPVVSLCLPVLALCLSAEGNALLRTLCAAGMSVVLLGTGFTQARFSIDQAEITPARRQEAEMIVHTGVKMGYATFWNANIVTELSDGAVEMVSIALEKNAQDQAYPKTGDWLEAKENLGLNRPQEPVMLLLSLEEAGSMEAFLTLCAAQEIELPVRAHRLFIIATQQEFFDAAQAVAQQ